ncbi:MAG: hypothetical protein QXT63_09370, partial [Thermoplasmata archaeon]
MKQIKYMKFLCIVIFGFLITLSPQFYVHQFNFNNNSCENQPSKVNSQEFEYTEKEYFQPSNYSNPTKVRQAQGKEYVWSYPISLPNTIDISSDGSLILAGEGRTQPKQNIKLYLIKNDGSLVWEQTFPDTVGDIKKVVLSDDGNLACAMTNSKVYLFSTTSSTELRNITASIVTCMDMSSDGRFVAVGFYGGEQTI